MNGSLTSLHIFGAESTAIEIRETAQLLLETCFCRIFLVVPEESQSDEHSKIFIDRLDVHLKSLQEGERHSGAASYVLSMSNQKVRSNLLKLAEAKGLQAASVIHPTAYVSPSAQVGDGVYIAAHSVVSSEAIVDDHVIINYQCTIGHHSRIGSHSTLNPGSRVSGNCYLGQRVLVGANSMILQGKRIGDDTQIDAMTYVDRDIEAGQLCTSRQLKVVKRPGFRRYDHPGPS